MQIRYAERPEWLPSDTDLVMRVLALRKARLIPIVLLEQGRWYVCDSEVDPWGTKVEYTKEDVWKMVRKVEANEILVKAAS